MHGQVKCRNHVTFSKIFVTYAENKGATFNVYLKSYYYVALNHPTRIDCCRGCSLAYQQIHPYGTHNQKYPQCCCCNCCSCLASEGIWSFPIPEGYQYIERLA